MTTDLKDITPDMRRALVEYQCGEIKDGLVTIALYCDGVRSSGLIQSSVECLRETLLMLRAEGARPASKRHATARSGFPYPCSGETE